MTHRSAKGRRLGARWAAVVAAAVGLVMFGGVAVAAADPIPTPSAAPPPGIADKATTLLGFIQWGGLIVCLGSLFIGGAIIAVKHRRGEGAEAMQSVLFPMIGTVVIGGAAALIGFMAA
jgi:hypothetical protein